MQCVMGEREETTSTTCSSYQVRKTTDFLSGLDSAEDRFVEDWWW